MHLLRGLKGMTDIFAARTNQSHVDVIDLSLGQMDRQN